VVSLNKVMIIGNVGGDPEMRFTPAGHPVTSFSVATNRTINIQGAEPKKETEWFSVVAWEKLAEQCNQFLAKGRLVYVEGRLQTRTWDSQDGQKHYKTEVVANRVMPLDKRPTAPGETAPGTETAGEISPDDIPF